MKFRKTLVMLLAACLMVGTIAGTTLAAGYEDAGKVESGIFDPGEGPTVAKPYIERMDIYVPAYEFAAVSSDGSIIAGTIGNTNPYTGWYMFGDNWVYYRNGELQRHWQLIDGKWYYFNTYGFMVQNGVAWIENKLYYFAADGHCDTTPGWKTVYGPYFVYENDNAFMVYPIGVSTSANYGQGNGNVNYNSNVQPYFTYFYLNEAGYIQTGWNYIDGTWHMVDKETGRVLCNEWYVGEGGYWYYFDEYTDMVTGWQTISSQFRTDRTYYFNEYGVCQWGWLFLNGNWYYLNPVNAARVENSWALIPDPVIGDWWYLFDNDGVMQTGWKYRKTGEFYWLDRDGNIIGDQDTQPAPQGATRADVVAWYYLSSWGGMVTGEQYINGKWYNFDNKTGEMLGIWDPDVQDYVMPLDKSSNYLIDGESQKPKSDFLNKVDYAN